ncbi:hypothetical protein KP509_1Z041200 [Ceratopteris richardii]|nr:hypothetical protein KP509_1Z041200 [Ceratopteris richardii]
MQKISGVQSAEGCNAIGITCFPSTFCSVENAVEDYPTPLSTWCHSPQRLLALDGIQDPGNLGTLLRTAAAFDWDGVFLFNGCCDPFNEKVVRASRGACFWIPIACGHWRQLRGLAEKRKMVFYAGESQGRVSRLASEQKVSSEQERGSYVTVSPGVYPLREDDSMHESLCLILGNEGRGLSKESRASCRLVSIPMPGKFESLNVAVAGGILLYLLQKRLHRT